MIYFLADPHFDHENVLKFEKRPFETIEEMAIQILYNINEVVKPEDTLVLVGDVCFGHRKHWRRVLDLIDCKNVVLVRGNHDRTFPANLPVIVVEEMRMKICKQNVIVSHYPFRYPWYKHWWGLLRGRKPRYRERRPKDDGKSFVIHGHTHGKEKTKGRMINVGVDAREFKPVSMAQIMREIQWELG